MKLAILVLGKTGGLIQSSALQRGHTVITVDPTVPGADFKTLQDAPLADCDCCIDFTSPAVILDSIKYILPLGTDLVVGTTGWYDEIDTVQAWVREHNASFLYASNFSIGVHLFSAVLQKAAEVFNAFDEYDVAGMELHHNQKADSPSGTACTVADILLNGIDRKTEIVYGAPDRQILPHELQFSSLRCGDFPGTHEAIFD